MDPLSGSRRKEPTVKLKRRVIDHLVSPIYAAGFLKPFEVDDAAGQDLEGKLGVRPQSKEKLPPRAMMLKAPWEPSCTPYPRRALSSV
jgi:hypothetical protein